MRSAIAATAASLLLLAACSGRERPGSVVGRDDLVRVARLGLRPEDPPGFGDLRAAFTARNAGYDVRWHARARALDAGSSAHIAFVQGGAARGRVGGDGIESDLVVGDVVVLRPRQSLSADAPLDLLVFTVPEAPGPGVPAVIRPDRDPRITDTPGGCATDPGAYRRLLLTWDPARGPYVFHKLNAHRIRADDSFTHYHPEEGGFDELYLVQEAPPGSMFLYSYERERMEQPDKVSRSQAQDLMRTYQHMTPEQAAKDGQENARPSLLPGDLIYIPRGVVHRGLGGIVAQVIAVPGFRPGGEVGVDHLLEEINERLDLAGPQRLPFHEGR